MKQPMLGNPQPQERSTAIPLSSHWIRLGRWLWALIALLILVLAVAGTPLRFTQLLTTIDPRAGATLGLSEPFYAGYVTTLGLTVLVVHLLIAAFIVWRRSDDFMALFVAFTLMANGAIASFYRLYTGVIVEEIWGLLLKVVIFLGLLSSVTLLYLFPNGRFVPRWTLLLALLWGGTALVAIFLPDSMFSLLQWPTWVRIGALLAWTGSGVLAQVYRYVDVSSPLQRQQTKWAIAGLAAAVLGPLFYFLPSAILPLVDSSNVSNVLYQRIGATFFAVSLLYRLVGLTFITGALLIFPLTFAIAILRYRLWDIDIIINRTIVYTLLTGALMMIYFISVVVFEGIFRLLTGQGTTLAVVLSTLAIAALFTPLRQCIQEAIDRRFYRHKYDAQKALAAFSRTMRDEVNLNNLTAELVSVIQETMQPAYVSLWFCEEVNTTQPAVQEKGS